MRAYLLVVTAIVLARLGAAQQRPPEPAPMADDKYGKAAEIMALPQAKLVALLEDPGASAYARAKACQRLAVVGDKSAVPALAALLTDPRLSHYARFGLEPIPDPAVDEALRTALGKVKGKMLVGVVNSIARRKDAGAIGTLSKLLRDSDRDVARAAEVALAHIRPPF